MNISLTLDTPVRKQANSNYDSCVIKIKINNKKCYFSTDTSQTNYEVFTSFILAIETSYKKIS